MNNIDIAILGCGPAGLSAAVNASIRNKKILIIGNEVCSPPLHKAQRINNYLGLPGITGKELLERFMEHIDRMHIQISNSKADLINENDGTFRILSNDDVINSKAIVIATGIPYHATLPDEERFLGRGLGYCATCDGPLYRGKVVMLVSHDATGENEANFMAEICRQVYYLPLYPNASNLDSRIIMVSTKPEKIEGQDYVTGLLLNDGQRIELDGLFIMGGETAPARLLPGLDMEDKHIKVNRQQETNLPGVFAAGDCTGPPYQVAKSVGEGQVAGLNASKYVSSLK